MLHKFNHIITVLTITAISSLFSPVALSLDLDKNNENLSIDNSQVTQPQLIAQSSEIEVYSDVPPQESVQDLFYRAYFDNSGDFYEQTNILGQFNFLFGWEAFPEGSYPENQISRDGENIEIIYRDYMKQQTTTDPVIRTRDLENPFNSSIYQNPSYLR